MPPFLPKMPTFLRAQHISKRFGGVIALDDVSLEIEEGQIVGLVGENGSGKSTLIKIISGVYTPDQGDIYIRERHYKHLTPIQAIKEGISVIYQDFALCPNLSIAENIAIARWVFSGRRIIHWRRMYQEAYKALRQLSEHIPLGIEVSKLSTADRQIVAIARALVENAKLIIMDEPTTALTEKEIFSLFDVLKTLSSKGISILFVSHKLQEVKSICNRIIVLRDGRKVFDGTSTEADIQTLQIYMTGRAIEPINISSHEIKEESPLLKVEGLTLEPYFIDINFELRQHEVLGITGLLGSGRRELALALVGLMKPVKGKIEIKGQPVKIKNIWEAWSLGIAYVPEDRVTEGLHLPCSITANILLPNLRRFSNRVGFFNYRKHRLLGEHWRQRLSIKAPSSETPVANLSGGNQQRVVLAKCLSTEPQILILNSPTMGVDVASKAAIHRLIRDLCEKGIGIILFSDDIPELLQTCNKIVVLKRGRIAYTVNAGEITEAELYRMLLEE
ncbi:MAG: sugar ABC transporter ATP-binding protein [Thermosphaera sp.]